MGKVVRSVFVQGMYIVTAFRTYSAEIVVATVLSLSLSKSKLSDKWHKEKISANFLYLGCLQELRISSTPRLTGYLQFQLLLWLNRLQF